MFDFSVHSILESNLFNFLIMVALFWFIASKMKLGEQISKAHGSERQNILNSDNEKEKSMFNLKEVKASLSNLGAEIERIFAEGKKIIEDLENAVKLELKEIEQIYDVNTKKILDVEDEKIKTATKAELAQKGVEIAQNKLTETLKQDKNLHKKFIDSAIDELDGVEIK